MDNEAFTPLAKRLKCAYLSYHMGISLSYCMKTYVDNNEIEKYWYEMARIMWDDIHGEPRKHFRLCRFEDLPNSGGSVGRTLLHRRNAFRAKFGRQPTPDDPFFFDPTKSYPVPAPHQDVLNRFLENGKAAGQTKEESLALFYQIFRFPVQVPENETPPEES